MGLPQLSGALLCDTEFVGLILDYQRAKSLMEVYAIKVLVKIYNYRVSTQRMGEIMILKHIQITCSEVKIHVGYFWIKLIGKVIHRSVLGSKFVLFQCTCHCPRAPLYMDS